MKAPKNSGKAQEQSLFSIRPFGVSVSTLEKRVIWGMGPARQQSEEVSPTLTASGTLCMYEPVRGYPFCPQAHPVWGCCAEPRGTRVSVPHPVGALMKPMFSGDESSVSKQSQQGCNFRRMRYSESSFSVPCSGLGVGMW